MFNYQLVQGYLGGETLHSLPHRQDLSRTLIRVWMDKSEAGAFDESTTVADSIQGYLARIATLECPVGNHALELAFAKRSSAARMAAEKRAPGPSSPARRPLR